MRKSVLITIAVVAVLIIAGGFFLSNKSTPSGSGQQTSQEIPSVPLTSQQRQVVTETVAEAEFLKDLPEDEPIEIVFYDFDTGERRYRDRFLVNNQGLIDGVKPTLYIYVHAKYIDQMKQDDLCTVVQQANKNGDVGTYSEYSNPRLLLKYSGMLKHKSCLGL